MEMYADICAEFHRVAIGKEDKDAKKFLWRSIEKSKSFESSNRSTILTQNGLKMNTQMRWKSYAIVIIPTIIVLKQKTKQLQ